MNRKSSIASKLVNVTVANKISHSSDIKCNDKGYTAGIY